MRRLLLLLCLSACAGLGAAGCVLDETGLGKPLLGSDGSAVDRGVYSPDAGAGGDGAAGDGAASDGAAGDGGAPDGAADGSPDGSAADGAGGGGTDGDAAGDGGDAGDAAGDRGGGSDAGGDRGSCSCGPCQRCAPAGGCQLDPESRWTIVAESAELTALSPVGLPWDRTAGDLGGVRPDPFCEFEMPAGVVTAQTAGVTNTTTDSFTATWNEVISPPDVTIRAADLTSPTTSWSIWVGDDEGNGRGQIACLIRQPMQPSWLLSGGFTLKNVGSCQSLSVKMVCAP